MDKRLTQDQASATGDDGLAPFHLWTMERWNHDAFELGQPFKCDCCGKDVNTVIRYSNAKATGIVAALRRYANIEEFSRLVLKSPNHVLGVDCGCYARFQRQLAHIRSRQPSGAASG